MFCSRAFPLTCLLWFPVKLMIAVLKRFEHALPTFRELHYYVPLFHCLMSAQGSVLWWFLYLSFPTGGTGLSKIFQEQESKLYWLLELLELFTIIKREQSGDTVLHFSQLIYILLLRSNEYKFRLQLFSIKPSFWKIRSSERLFNILGFQLVNNWNYLNCVNLISGFSFRLEGGIPVIFFRLEGMFRERFFNDETLWLAWTQLIYACTDNSLVGAQLVLRILWTCPVVAHRMRMLSTAVQNEQLHFQTILEYIFITFTPIVNFILL